MDENLLLCNSPLKAVQLLISFTTASETNIMHLIHPQSETSANKISTLPVGEIVNLYVNH